MSLDAYAPCPCGSGNKVKFCCAKDVVADLDKAIRALEGDQRMAALEILNQLSEKHPGLGCVMALKGGVQMQLGEQEAAEKTIAEFVVSQPNNPTALAQSAMIEGSKRNAETAVKHLQRALEEIDKNLSMNVYEAIGFVGQVLLMTGNYMAARGHFLLQAGLGGSSDTRGMSMLLRLNAMPDIPLLLKQDVIYESCPDDVDWADEFNSAMQLAGRGAWAKACEKLTALDKKSPGQPSIWKNIAILRGWLGDNMAACAAWRKFSSLEGIPLDDAVEAEALAQTLDTELKEEMIEELQLDYPITDVDALMERLLTDKRVAKTPVDLSEFNDADEPPPKAVFALLDMPLPDEGDGLTIDTVPNILGEILVFGKQTDREARLELIVSNTSDFDDRTKKLTEIVGELVGEPSQKVLGETPASSEALTWRWRFPEKTSRETHAKLIAEKRRETVQTQWPMLKSAVIDNKTPREVAADPAYRVRVLAAMLAMELNAQQNQWDADFAKLRDDLGLPHPADVDAKNTDIARLPLVRLSRLDVKALSDDDLTKAYRRAVMMNYVAAVKSLAAEVLDRETLDETVDKAEACGILAQVSGDLDKAAELLVKAGEIETARGESPAKWLLEEFGVRLQRGEPEECQRLVQRIQSQHIREPGIADQLYQMLVQYGLVSPDGQPVGAPSAPAAEESSKLWTPESETGTGGGESKLWVPGMD